jgi:hypothetical protein
MQTQTQTTRSQTQTQTHSWFAHPRFIESESLLQACQSPTFFNPSWTHQLLLRNVPTALQRQTSSAVPNASTSGTAVAPAKNFTGNTTRSLAGPVHPTLPLHLPKTLLLCLRISRLPSTSLSTNSMLTLSFTTAANKTSSNSSSTLSVCAALMTTLSKVKSAKALFKPTRRTASPPLRSFFVSLRARAVFYLLGGLERRQTNALPLAWSLVTGAVCIVQLESRISLIIMETEICQCRCVCCMRRSRDVDQWVTMASIC